MPLYFSLGFADTYMPLLTVVIYILLWKHIQKQELLLLLYIVFSIILFGISNILALHGINNLVLYHIFSLVKTIVISYYILKLTAKKSLGLLIRIISGLYSAIWILNILFFEPPDHFNSTSAGLSNLIILFLCMYYLLSLSKTKNIMYFQKLPSFWIISGFLIDSSLSLLVIISLEYFNLAKRANEANAVLSIVSVATIIQYILISIGLLCYKRSYFSRTAKSQKVPFNN